MTSTDIKDKLVLDPSDTPKLREFFSRCEPGETLGKITIEGAIFEENSPEVIVIAISGNSKITVEYPKDKVPKGKKDESEAVEESPEGEKQEDDGEQSAALTVYKKDGNSSGEDNVPTETQPMR